MADAIWTASLRDDVSTVSSKMATSIKNLDATASSLFKQSGGNFKDFEKNLHAAGVSTLDARLASQKYREELIKTRREMLGIARDATQTGNTLKEITRGALRGIGERALNIPGMLVSGAVGAITTIGEKVYDVGKGLVDSVIEAAQFRQNAITGLEYMLGTRREAEQIFADAQKLAQDTPLDTDKVITGIKQLVTAGFSGKDSMLLFKAVADQASKFADDQEMQTKVISAFSRVKGRGVATAEDLESFRVAGFRAEGIIQSLLENEGLAPLFKKIKRTPTSGSGKAQFIDQSQATQEEILKQVKSVLGDGKVGSTSFLNAAIKSLERNKPDIGEFAKQMGKVSLTGTISNFKSAFGDLLKSTKIDEWSGVQSFQKFLTRMTEALQGPVGQKVLETVKSIINALLGGLDRIQSTDIEGFAERIVDIGKDAVKVIEQAWNWLDRLLHGDMTLGDDISDVLVDVGRYIGEGVARGMKDAALGLSSGDEKFIKKYGASKDKVEAFALTHGYTGSEGRKKFMQEYSTLLPKFYEAGAAGEIDSASSGGVDLLEKVWKFRETAGVIEQRLKEAADRQTLLDTLDTGQYGTTKGGGGTGSWIYGQMWDVGTAGGQGLEDGARKRLKTGSPSRTMAKVGEDAAAGLVLGTEKGIAEGKTPRGGITLSVSVSVGNVSGDAMSAAQTIGDIVAERTMIALMERKALEGGAAA